MTRPFRFGVVAPLMTDVPTWRDRVRRIADSGYSTLLVADFPLTQPAPGPMLATAAALTDLRVGTWVYASPLRPPWQTAWEAHSLSLLTEGRFEMGIGTGRPGIEDELRDKGLPVLPPSGRLAEVRKTVEALRDLDGPDLHTPVAMAVLGPKARALAAEIADIVTFALGDQSRSEVERLARDFRATGDQELALAVPVVGDTVARHMAPRTPIRPPCVRWTHWRCFRTTLQQPSRKSSGVARSSASPTSSSAPTSPSGWLRSSPNSRAIGRAAGLAGMRCPAEKAGGQLK
ncbi:LLM class flavin-dependent oxidoreductase [Nocardia africana]|uniref:Probable F420-dependent oxidoreductase, MSMEG_2516 family n=1 Tax=Nocardia africana TaxID=134964 RepID=A0A378WQW0_9NOCA|nr:LLM class flavin-dependent oxidoreductase [Nocardia africana]SUA42713.1 probable F420-dependent oxidoreductase, MSMEG_2516 family [Nocardia africana]